MADVQINVGSDGGRLERSPVTIGNVAGGDMTSYADRQIDAVWTEIQEVKLRMTQVEKAIEGNLGMPGISAELLAVKESILRVENKLSLLNNEKYLVSKGVFYGTLGLLILMTAFYLFTK